MVLKIQSLASLTLLGLLFVAIVCASPVLAQECTPNSILLHSQSEVDNFQANHGPCDTVTGDLSVIGDDIVDLSPLSALTSVGDELYIGSNDALINLDGLSSLTSVGGYFGINSNEALTNLDSLSSLTSVGRFAISANAALNNIDGLSALTRVDSNFSIRDNTALINLDGLSALTSVAGELSIDNNVALTNIDGLSNLTSVRGLVILNNDALTNLNALSALTSMGGGLYIRDNAGLTNLDGLSALSSVGEEVYVWSNDALTNLDGLANLTSVGSHLVIRSNAALTNVDGLANLTSVGWALAIISNSALTDIDGLANLASTGPLNILNNVSLTDIDGLSNLTNVRNELHIGSNTALTNIDGLSNLTRLWGDLTIEGNEVLTNINGLANLISVEWNLGIWGNAALTNLDGLANLTSVGIMLSVNGNAVLSNIDGLANLASVGHELHFYSNAALTNLDGLSAVTSVGGDLYVWGHELLGDCEGLTRLVDQRDDASPGPGPGEGGVPDVGGRVRLGKNHSGCNSISEILGDLNGFPINPGLNDAWYDPSTDGQGILITVLPETGGVFLAWFTYDTELPPEDATANLGDPGHRWLTAQGAYAGNQSVMDIVLTSGGLFDTPSEVSRTDPPGSDGTLILTFDDCYTGIIEYDIPSISRQGVVPIQRVLNDNVVLCEELAGHVINLPESDPENPLQFGPDNDMNPGLNDAWYDPETDGQGILVSVLPDTKAVFLAWFTYDTELPPEDATANLGDPGHRWLTAQGTYAGGESVMNLVVTSGGLFDYPTEVERTDPPGSDGTVILTFDDCYSGTLEYDISSINQQGTIPIQRVVPDNVALCEALMAQ